MKKNIFLHENNSQKYLSCRRQDIENGWKLICFSAFKDGVSKCAGIAFRK